MIFLKQVVHIFRQEPNV